MLRDEDEVLLYKPLVVYDELEPVVELPVLEEVKLLEVVDGSSEVVEELLETVDE